MHLFNIFIIVQTVFFFLSKDMFILLHAITFEYS